MIKGEKWFYATYFIGSICAVFYLFDFKEKADIGVF